MREGWFLHRFDEVFNLQMGKTPDRKTPQYFGGDNVWVSIRDLVGKEISDSNEHITDEAVLASNIRQVKKGTVIMSFKLTVGRCAIAARDLYTNEAIMAFNVKEGYEISPDYLYYYLQGYKWEGANKAVMGLTLNKATISQHKIGIPPIDTQNTIVSELDKINELISLKKEQLKDYDNLAQSIFYDMFGDPVTNDKGWEVKKLEEVSTIFAGGDKPTDILNHQEGEYQYPVIANGDGEKGILGYTKTYKVKDMAVTIGARGASIGNCRIITTSFTPAIRLITIIPTDKLICQYLFFFVQGIKYNINGAGQAQLTVPNIKKEPLPLPPLPLQQAFAKRIEAIEQQKQLISSEIKDLETLLASRMQYWFD